jgi:hypothetical protein
VGRGLFFDSFSQWEGAYANKAFNYIAFEREGKFYLAQGLLAFNTGKAPASSQFASEHVRAGRYLLSDLNQTPRGFIEELLSGELSTPSGKLFFPPPDTGRHLTTFLGFHPLGLQNQNRINVLYLTGASQTQFMRQPLCDWELKAASPPYDGVQELMTEYGLGTLRVDNAIVEAIALNAAVVEFASAVNETKARPAMRLANGLNPDKAALGYRVFSQGTVVARSRISGSEMQWSKQEDYQRGECEVDIPQGAVLHCIATYAEKAQHFGWISDPSTVQNPRRTIYEAFDPGLVTLKDILARSQGRGLDARDLEAGVAWLWWMLGFSVAHLGGTRRTQEAVDLVVVAPNGQVAVIECTTGLLKAESKLSLLYDRTQAVRRALDSSNSRHLSVLPIIVTSKTREEIRPDLEQAEKVGILVVAREDLEQAIERTIVVPNADAMFEEALQSVRSAQAKYEAQATLPLPSPDLNGF